MTLSVGRQVALIGKGGYSETYEFQKFGRTGANNTDARRQLAMIILDIHEVFLKAALKVVSVVETSERQRSLPPTPTSQFQSLLDDSTATISILHISSRDDPIQSFTNHNL